MPRFERTRSEAPRRRSDIAIDASAVAPPAQPPPGPSIERCQPRAVVMSERQKIDVDDARRNRQVRPDDPWRMTPTERMTRMDADLSQHVPVVATPAGSAR